MKVSNEDWFAIRAVARRRDWQGVSQRAEVLGWPLVAKRARMIPFDPDSLPALIWALRLDLPDEHWTGDAADG